MRPIHSGLMGMLELIKPVPRRTFTMFPLSPLKISKKAVEGKKWVFNVSFQKQSTYVQIQIHQAILKPRYRSDSGSVFGIALAWSIL